MASHAENEKKPIYKKWWFWLLIIIVVVTVGSQGGGNNETQQTSTTITNGENTNQPIEYTSVNIDELEEALKNNAAAAKDTYNGKYLAITGKLGTIDSDLKYIGLLSTTNNFDLTGVHCTIKNEEQKNVVKTLKKDDTIVVKGKITNVGEVLGYYLDIAEITK